MKILEIYTTQHRLARAAQIPAMVCAVKRGDILPPIVLHELDGKILVNDGHHRLAAYWLAGRSDLEVGEYTLVPVDCLKPSRGKIPELVDRYLSICP